MITNCIHCDAGKHPGICPTIKAIEYHQDGTVKRVEYKCSADYGPVLSAGVPAPVPGQLTYVGAGAAQPIADMNTAHSFTIGPDGVARFS